MNVIPALSLRKPPRLQSGDRIALVAPASAFLREAFEAGLDELARLGFEGVYDERVFLRGRFTAGDPTTRAAAIHDAWRDPTIAALLAVRGGYGSAQVLPLLDAALLRQAQKLFIGYSDLTALLQFHVQQGVTCVHGPMIEHRLSAGTAGYDRASFVAAVTVAEPMGELTPPGLRTLREGRATGVLTGGTLSQLVSSLATPWAFNPPPGCVLFLEDVGERPYRIHRMLTQLEQAGLLGRAAALVFGEMPSCDEPGGRHTIADVLADYVAALDVPVIFGFPSGHTVGPAWTLPFGVRATVDTQPHPRLIIEEAVVA